MELYDSRGRTLGRPLKHRQTTFRKSCGMSLPRVLYETEDFSRKHPEPSLTLTVTFFENEHLYFVLHGLFFNIRQVSKMDRTLGLQGLLLFVTENQEIEQDHLDPDFFIFLPSLTSQPSHGKPAEIHPLVSSFVKREISHYSQSQSRYKNNGPMQHQH